MKTKKPSYTELEKRVIELEQEQKNAKFQSQNDIELSESTQKNIETELRLKIAQKASKAGIWDWNLETNSFFWSEEYYILYGLPKDAKPGLETWKKAVHPDDLEEALKKIYESIDNRTEVINTYRIILPNNEIRWIRSMGNTYYENDKPKRIIGICIDITQSMIEEEALQQREASIRTLVENIDEVFTRFDLNLRCQYISPSVRLISEIDPEFMIGKTILEVGFSKEQSDFFNEVLKGVIDSGQSRIIEFSVTLNEKTIFLYSKIYPEYDKNGHVRSVVTLTYNITDRKKTETVLKKSEANLKTISENSPDTIMQIDKEGTIIYINKLMPGLTYEQVIGSKIYNWVHESNYEIVKKGLDEVFVNGRSFEYETEGPGHNISTRFYSVRINPVIIEGKTESAIYLTTDITEGRKIENALKESKEKFSKIFDRAPVLISISDLNDGTYIEINDFALTFSGFSREEVIGHKSYEIGWITKENWELLKQTLINKGKIENLELPFKTKTGKEVYGIVNGEKIILDNKECFLTITTDITERIIAEKALKESEENLQEAQRISKIGNYCLNLTNSEILWSKECYSIFEINESVNQDKLISVVKEKIHPEDYPLLVNNAKEAIKQKVGFSSEHRLILKSGIKNILSIAEPVKNQEDNVTGFKGTLQDISERKVVEEALQQAENNHKRFMDESTLGIRILTKEGKTVYVNKALLEIYGFNSIEEFHDTPISKRYTVEEFNRHIVRKKERKRGEMLSSNYEIDIVCRTGQIKHLQVIRKEIVWDKIPHFQVIYQDITDRKRFEQELLIAKEKAEESDLLKSAFLQNMSHEIRTPLNAIVGFAALMAKPNLSFEKLELYSDIINSKSEQLIGIITDMIEIAQIHARQIKANLSEFDLVKFIENLAIPFHRISKEKNIGLVLNTKIPYKEYILKSDIDKLSKIFNHIIGNALKFTQDGQVEITTELADECLHFTFSDSGIGISREMLEIIFEPFRQVETGMNRKFGGNGLGLAITKAYTELLGGTISIKSELNKGTTVYLTIPAPLKIKEPIVKVEKQKAFSGNKILIVEDEYSNYMYLEVLLEPLGIGNLHATNGLQAIDMCKEDEAIGLVLMDIKMPIMDGHTAAKRIKEFRPSLPIIAQTAFALPDEKELFVNDFDDYISKPINEEELKSKLFKYIIHSNIEP